MFSRTGLGTNQPSQSNSIGEEGFIDIFIIVIYFLFFLLILGMGIGIGVSVLRVANAEHGWFTEAMDYSARAANIDGAANMDQIISNQNKAQSILTGKLNAMMPGKYSLDSFTSINAGASIPHGTAIAPGYMAKITVKIKAITVPLIGEQDVSIPMAYFAVIKSVN